MVALRSAKLASDVVCTLLRCLQRLFVLIIPSFMQTMANFDKSLSTIPPSLNAESVKEYSKKPHSAE